MKFDQVLADRRKLPAERNRKVDQVDWEDVKLTIATVAGFVSKTIFSEAGYSIHRNSATRISGTQHSSNGREYFADSLPRRRFDEIDAADADDMH